MNLAALLLSYNEEENIERTLSALAWVPKIYLLDSHSTDATCDIARRFNNVVIEKRHFDDHTSQWNHGLLAMGIRAEWILALDADYLIPEALATEIQNVVERDSRHHAYWLSFDYAIAGKVIRSGVYPPVQSLFRRRYATFEDDGHTQRVNVQGAAARLKNKAIHDDRKSFPRWIRNQLKYSKLEAQKIQLTPSKQLSKTDRLREKSIFIPMLMFLYCYIYKAGFLDGKHGILYAFQRSIAEAFIQYRLIEERLNQ